MHPQSSQLPEQEVTPTEIEESEEEDEQESEEEPEGNSHDGEEVHEESEVEAPENDALVGELEGALQQLDLDTPQKSGNTGIGKAMAVTHPDMIDTLVMDEDDGTGFWKLDSKEDSQVLIYQPGEETAEEKAEDTNLQTGEPQLKRLRKAGPDLEVAEESKSQESEAKPSSSGEAPAAAATATPPPPSRVEENLVSDEEGHDARGTFQAQMGWEGVRYYCITYNAQVYPSSM